MKKRSRSLIILIISISIALVLANFKNSSARKHKTVPEKKRHELLEGGPYKSTFETRDLKLVYQYTREPGRLIMSGEVKFVRSINLDSFTLGANLINAEGKIVHKEMIAAGGGRRQVEEIPFEKEIKAPDATWGVAFSYNGSARGTGEGGGSASSFWQGPF